MIDNGLTVNSTGGPGAVKSDTALPPSGDFHHKSVQIQLSNEIWLIRRSEKQLPYRKGNVPGDMELLIRRGWPGRCFFSYDTKKQSKRIFPLKNEIFQIFPNDFRPQNLSFKK